MDKDVDELNKMADRLWDRSPAPKLTPEQLNAIDLLILGKTDREGCISCGACWESCPEFFEENPDDNFSQVVEKFRSGGFGEGEAPDDLTDCMIKASENCPAEVIQIS